MCPERTCNDVVMRTYVIFLVDKVHMVALTLVCIEIHVHVHNISNTVVCASLIPRLHLPNDYEKWEKSLVHLGTCD